MDQPHTGQDFHRQRADEYAAAYVSTLDASPRTKRQARWALGWIVAGAPTIVLDGDVIIRWLLEQGLTPTSRQTIWDRVRLWYRWMTETYPGEDLPVLGPYNFGRRRLGERRGRKSSRAEGQQEKEP